MFKKILLLLTILIIVLSIIIFTPLSSLMLKEFLEYKVKNTLKAEMKLEGFKYSFSKTLTAKRVLFHKKNFNLEAENVILEFESISLNKKSFVADFSAQTILARHKNQKFLSTTSVLSEISDGPDLKDIKFNTAKSQIAYFNDSISFNNIEALNDKIKILGDIKYQKEKTDYDLTLYLPVKVGESLPDLAKVLLNVKNEDGWSKIDIRVSIPN